MVSARNLSTQARLVRLLAIEEYELGRLVSRMLSLARYGNRGIALADIVQSSGHSPRWLFSLRRVAECWSRAKFEKLLARGVPLGHLVLIAEVRDQDQRMKLLDLVVRRRLTYRQLLQAVRRCRRTAA